MNDELPSDAIETVFDYHDLSKHQFHRSAPGPGYLDWANQPNPFRRYQGAKELPLTLVHEKQSPSYEEVLSRTGIIAQPLNFETISQLFQDSLALSAWKRYQDSTWALRVNPSSGNLHPTEGYLITGPVSGLTELPTVAHYAPKEHLLEVRAQFSDILWKELSNDLPKESFLIALTSIHWREAWKYGERAFRYCNHDVGHAIGAIAIAAAALGWETRLISHFGTSELESLLGLNQQLGPDKEHPDCCLAIFPFGNSFPNMNGESLFSYGAFDALEWHGTPNQLSSEHEEWRWVEKMGQVTRKQRTEELIEMPMLEKLTFTVRDFSLLPSSPPLRKIIHQRRSAVSFDGLGSMSAKSFYAVLERTLRSSGRIPFEVFPWEPTVNFLIFVHRVDGIEPGLYFFFRNLSHLPFLKENCRSEFTWNKPSGCPDAIPFYTLLTGDSRETAKALSCTQDIAGDGCFSLGMITHFEDPIQQFGPWFYPRLFWEAGLVGQVLYLEAEVVGIRATGIGCYFDDPVHELLGLKGRAFQSLYHFTVGHPVEDKRLLTLPPYSAELWLRKRPPAV